MSARANQQYLTHDVMCLVDIMVEDYAAGRMFAYNTMREDLAQWVNAVEGLLQATKAAIPLVDRLAEEARRRGSLSQLDLSLAGVGA